MRIESGITNANIRHEEALQTFDGLMLGDAGLLNQSNSCRFSLGLSDSVNHKYKLKIAPEQFLAYLVIIKKELGVLYITFSATTPKLYQSTSKGKPYTQALLRSLNSVFLLQQYDRWYKGGVLRVSKRGIRYMAGAEKIVPEGLILKPRTLARFVEGDGTSVWFPYDNTTVLVSLCTQGFGITGICNLEEQLHSLGLMTGRTQLKTKSGSGVKINKLQESVDLFMSIIEPHILSPYLYKVKFRGSKQERYKIYGGC